MKKIIFKNNQGVAYKEIKFDGDPTALIMLETNEQWADGMAITADVVDITYLDALALCHQQRLSEYPALGDLVEAIIENDTVRKNELKALRNAVKAKYPKPVEPT